MYDFTLWGVGSTKYFEDSVFEDGNDNDNVGVGLNDQRCNDRPSPNLKINSQNDLQSPTEAIYSS